MNQASTRRTLVIVGGGSAGAEAAKTLRADGFDGRVVLVGQEPGQPYERPPLSKDYLRGETPREKLLVREPSFYEENDIEVLTDSRATELRPGERVLVLEGGRRIPFDGLLLATGSSPRVPAMGAVPGRGGVHVLRTIEDADRLRTAAGGASTAIVAGGGWIAAEAAASLQQLGLAVTLVVPGGQVLERSLGAEIGATYTTLHRRHGVRVVTHARVAEIVDGTGGSGITLEDGQRLLADVVVLGFGATPNVELARAAGLDTGDGILVDERLATSVPGILAAGDVASAWHPRYGVRVRSEHWDNARRQGRTAARNLLGAGEAYARVPYFYSDQFDLGMEFIGRSADADRLVVRRAGDDSSFIAFWLREGRIVAGMHGNVWDAKRAIDALVSSGAAPDPRSLADPAVPLVDLIPAPGPSAVPGGALSDR